jgi:DNA-binding transcriptional MerR regulator
VRIGELAQRAGTTARTVRYYVAQGLLPPPVGAGPASVYGYEHLVRLGAIRALKARYLPLAEIRRQLAAMRLEEIEALVVAPDAPEAALDALRVAVAEAELRVARWLVFHAGEPATQARWVQLARARLGGDAPFGGRADTHFTELNRNRPPMEALDFIGYPISAQVHDYDDLSVMETLQGQSATVESARAFAGGRPIVVGPVTLRRRPPAAGRYPPEDWRSTDDPRQTTPFAAAWTLGSLSALVLLAMVPVFVLALLMQRHIVRGLTLGAVKG